MTGDPAAGHGAGAVRTKLAAAAGLDTSGGNLAYSSATKSLTFRLQKDNFDPAGRRA